ncbi:jg17160 [Pararge aegeria aegeria]|uniref:Jg17160 protein n=1 Tax=Pararge aegeria aegeria TaxID=348720 RepID=A0A8S4RMD1_9NEOP|nr:jg17160 [Pararge aegeria aegeria]
MLQSGFTIILCTAYSLAKTSSPTSNSIQSCAHTTASDACGVIIARNPVTQIVTRAEVRPYMSRPQADDLFKP